MKLRETERKKINGRKWFLFKLTAFHFVVWSFHWYRHCVHYRSGRFCPCCFAHYGNDCCSWCCCFCCCWWCIVCTCCERCHVHWLINQNPTSVHCVHDKFDHDFYHSTFYHAHTIVDRFFHQQSIIHLQFAPSTALRALHLCLSLANFHRRIHNRHLQMDFNYELVGYVLFEGDFFSFFLSERWEENLLNLKKKKKNWNTLVISFNVMPVLEKVTIIPLIRLSVIISQDIFFFTTNLNGLKKKSNKNFNEKQNWKNNATKQIYFLLFFFGNKYVRSMSDKMRS